MKSLLMRRASLKDFLRNKIQASSTANRIFNDKEAKVLA